MLVKNILASKEKVIYSVKPTDTVYDAIAKMAEHNIGALLIMEGDKLVGILSERDYRNKVILKGRTSKTTQVSEIMVDKVVFVKPDDSINLCMQLMTDNRFRHLPVLVGDTVVGMLSIGDVVKSVIQGQKVEIDSLRDFITGGYPG